MKKLFVFIIAGMMASAAYAGPLDFCNQTSADSNNQSSYQPFNSYRGQIVMAGTGAAPSVTLPSLKTGMRTLRIDFQDRNNYLFCLDSTSNQWCGTNPPTTTVSNTAWVYNQASVRVLSVSNTLPNTLWVSGTGVFGYSMCGMQ